MQRALLICAILALGVFSVISGGSSSSSSEEDRGRKDCENCDADFPSPPYLWEYKSTRKLDYYQKTRSVGTEKGTYYEVRTVQNEVDTYEYPNTNNAGGQAAEKSDLSPPAKRSSLIEENNFAQTNRMEQIPYMMKNAPVVGEPVSNDSPK